MGGSASLWDPVTWEAAVAWSRAGGAGQGGGVGWARWGSGRGGRAARSWWKSTRPADENEVRGHGQPRRFSVAFSLSRQPWWEQAPDTAMRSPARSVTNPTRCGVVKDTVRPVAAPAPATRTQTPEAGSNVPDAAGS